MYSLEALTWFLLELSRIFAATKFNFQPIPINLLLPLSPLLLSQTLLESANCIYLLLLPRKHSKLGTFRSLPALAFQPYRKRNNHHVRSRL